jgi:hypothetical protein
MTDEPATIKHRFVFTSDDGKDRHELIISPGETASFVANQTAIYRLHPDGGGIAMVKGGRLVINSKDNGPDYWGNLPMEINAEVIGE